MSPEMFNDMQTETSGKFGGLGIEVGMEHGVVKVISPIDNSNLIIDILYIFFRF